MLKLFHMFIYAYVYIFFMRVNLYIMYAVPYRSLCMNGIYGNEKTDGGEIRLDLGGK